MTLFDYLVPFVIVLGVLIFIHELGHFLIAKACRVKVERFSMGFGPAIARRKIGETEYRLAWFPLGGYVRMLGEVPGEAIPEGEEGRTFNRKPVWQRIAIAGAGPAMNFLLPVALLGGAYLVGVPTPTSRVGGVLPGSPAEEAGVLPGDRVLAVDGGAVSWWREVGERLQEGGARRVELLIDRSGERMSLSLLRDEDVVEHEPAGLVASAPAPVLALRSPDAPAARDGLRDNDRITRVGGVEIGDWVGLREALRSAAFPVEVEVHRITEGQTETLILTLQAPDAGSGLEALGLLPADLRVAALDPEGPAAAGGMEEGDLLVGVDGSPVASFRDLAERIRSSRGQPLRFELIREGKPLRVDVSPAQREVTERGIKRTVYAIGVQGGVPSRPETRPRRTANPIAALGLGAAWTGDIVLRTFQGVAMLISGAVGREGLAGPIGIGAIAADAFQAGWIEFVLIMAVISVNLAILNLLPIPVLDGGHILFALAEAVKGSPVSFRIREVAQQVGLAILFCLIVFAFWNDIARHWSGILDFFQGTS